MPQFDCSSKSRAESPIYMIVLSVGGRNLENEPPLTYSRLYLNNAQETLANVCKYVNYVCREYLGSKVYTYVVIHCPLGHHTTQKK